MASMSLSLLTVGLFAVAMNSRAVYGQAQKASSWCDATNWPTGYGDYHFMDGTFTNFSQLGSGLPTFNLSFPNGYGAPFVVECDGIADPLVYSDGGGQCNDMDHWDKCVRRCRRYTGEPPPNIRTEATCNKGGCDVVLYWNCSDPSYSSSIRREWNAKLNDWSYYKNKTSGLNVSLTAIAAPPIPNSPCSTSPPTFWTVGTFVYDALHVNWSQETIDAGGVVTGMPTPYANFNPKEDKLYQLEWHVDLVNPTINYTLGCRIMHDVQPTDVGRLEFTKDAPVPAGSLPKRYGPGDLYWGSCASGTQGGDFDGFPNTVAGWVAFDMTTHTLWFNETWTCDSGNSNTQTFTFASGQGAVSLECYTSLAQYPIYQPLGLPGSNTWNIHCDNRALTGVKDKINMNVVAARDATKQEMVGITISDGE